MWNRIARGKMKSYSIFCLVLMLFIAPSRAAAQAYANHVVGKVGDVSSTADGLLIRMEGVNQPTTCSNPYGWMIIPASSEIMASVALSYFVSGRRSATVYTQPQSSSSMCVVTQFDPYN